MLRDSVPLGGAGGESQGRGRHSLKAVRNKLKLLTLGWFGELGEMEGFTLARGHEHLHAHPVTQYF